MTLPFFTPESLARLEAAVLARVSGPNGIAILLLWATVLLAGGVTFIKYGPRPRSARGFFGYFLPASIFHHASARADVLFWLSRRITIPLMVIPLTVSTAMAGYGMNRLLQAIYGSGGHPAIHAGPLTLGLFTLTMLLAYDLSYYLYHFMQHKLPLLWELHKVHHSAEIMVGVTRDRVHPLDDLMNHWWDGLIPGACYGIWLFFALDPIEVTVFGLNVYVLRNTLFMMDFVRHTHLRLSYGRWLNAVFLCPHWHQLHHSSNPKHFDKNYGLMLSMWDWLFGTLVVPERGENFVFGLAAHEHEEYQSVLKLYVLPLKKMCILIRSSRPAFIRKPADDTRAVLLRPSKS